MNDNSFEQDLYAYNMKLYIDRGTLITAHISDLHFPVMNPQKQYQILEDQFLQKIEQMPRLDLVCINGDLFDHKIALSSDATLYASMFVARLVDICIICNSAFSDRYGRLYRTPGRKRHLPLKATARFSAPIRYGL